MRNGDLAECTELHQLPDTFEAGNRTVLSPLVANKRSSGRSDRGPLFPQHPTFRQRCRLFADLCLLITQQPTFSRVIGKTGFDPTRKSCAMRRL